MAPILAHARPTDDGTFEVHEVEEHLRAVADLAAGFAESFGAADWARLAGLWHDLGKYHPEFQGYIQRATGYDPDAHLEGAAGRVDHSTLGAVHAEAQQGWPNPLLGRLLAYVIAGHHAGLPDWNSPEEGGAALQPRLDRNRERLAAVLRQPIPTDVLAPPAPQGRPLGGREGVALWVRMLFSCLVDADFLDTERFLNAERAALRGRYPSLTELKQRFDAYMQVKAIEIARRGMLSDVNRIRAAVLRQCREKGALEPGLFSLTVPTGGGKTLSSMAFALEHAHRWEKRRIIYVIPYTSIIEQTAGVFREVFRGEDGEEPLVEHHSTLDAARETPHTRVAAENWDAPVIVTTAVQFFESLFAARTSRCRKLHNIVNSVVVLDEAQLLPPDFLQPILGALRLLSAHYGVSVVLCTATQPALEERKTLDYHFRGLRGVRELMTDPDPATLHAALRRVEVEVPRDLHAPTTWEQVAIELRTYPQVLCIVSRRDDCRELYRLLPPDTAIHLSALMCAEHRSYVIARIKRKLTAGEPVRVVSTQLVEAGVDLDFPVVYRALAGLDSIAQAAGRCNREGLLCDENGQRARGRVVVFVPPRPAPAGALRMAEDGGRQALSRAGADPLEPDRFADFFRELYWKYGDRLDTRGILGHLEPDGQLGIRFRTAAREFRLIEDTYLPIVVRYAPPVDTGDMAAPSRRAGTASHTGVGDLLDQLRYRPPSRDDYRRLQRFTVSIPRYLHGQLQAEGHVEELHPGLFVQVSSWLYHPTLGLRAGDDAAAGAADLVI